MYYRHDNGFVATLRMSILGDTCQVCGDEGSGCLTFNTLVKMKKRREQEGEEGKMWHDTKELVNLGEDIFPFFPADLRFST